jgi:hypothetical protein
MPVSEFLHLLVADARSAATVISGTSAHGVEEAPNNFSSLFLGGVEAGKGFGGKSRVQTQDGFDLPRRSPS